MNGIEAMLILSVLPVAMACFTEENLESTKPTAEKTGTPFSPGELRLDSREAFTDDSSTAMTEAIEISLLSGWSEKKSAFKRYTTVASTYGDGEEHTQIHCR
jgi:hypothetical protein